MVHFPAAGGAEEIRKESNAGFPMGHDHAAWVPSRALATESPVAEQDTSSCHNGEGSE